MRFNSGFLRVLAALMIIFCVVILTVPGDASAFSIKEMFTRVSATCGETLITGEMVAIKAADGYAYNANASDATRQPAVGIVGKGCSTGGTVEIVTYGIVTGWTSLSPGAPGFLSGTAGAVTQSSPVYSQQVGIAINATDYLINPLNYFNTSSLTALGVLAGATPIIMDGATADAYKTTIAVTDPTANRTVTLPDLSGTVAMTAGPGSYKTFTILTDNAVLTTADCGKVFGIGTDAKTITVPSTAAGCSFTFVNTGAAGHNILELVPAAADKVFGTVTLAASVVVINTSAGGHIADTKATSQRGDSITLLGDGVAGWYISAATGIWAAL